FSKRQNTTAAKLKNLVSNQEKKQRVRDLILLGQAKLDHFAKQRVGEKASVLFESETDGFWEGHSSEFLKVRVRSHINLKNQIQDVMLMNWSGKNFEGFLV